MFDDTPRKSHRRHFLHSWWTLRHDLFLPIFQVVDHIAILHQYAAADGPDIHFRFHIRRNRKQTNKTQTLFLLQEGTRICLKLRRDNDLAENLADRFSQRFGDGPIANNDSTERSLLVRGKCFLPRFAQIEVAADATRIRVFQNRNGWLAKLRDQICRGTDVENVIKRKFLAVNFLETFFKASVERGGLMRIFAVTQTHSEWERDRK